MSLIPRQSESKHLKVRMSGRRRATHVAYLRDDETYATPLILILLDRFGSDITAWSPMTIRMEVEDEFGVRLSRINLDKIMAGFLLLTTNYFYRDVVKFIWICNVLTGNEFDPDEFDPADPAEMLFAINEAFLLWPPSEDDPEEREFSPEIREYVQQALGAEGIVKPIDVLRIATNSDRTSYISEENFSDPEMYAAVYRTQQEKIAELATEHRTALLELLDQLTGLPLEHGSTEGLVARLRRAIHVFESQVSTFA